MPKFPEIKVKPVSRDDRGNKMEERKRKGERNGMWREGCTRSCSRGCCGYCIGYTSPGASWGAKQSTALSCFVDIFLAWGQNCPKSEL